MFFEKPLLVAQQTTQGPVVGENYGPVSFFFVFSGEWIDFYGVHGVHFLGARAQYVRKEDGLPGTGYDITSWWRFSNILGIFTPAFSGEDDLF